MNPLIVDVVRSGVVESSHLVDVAIAGSGGELVSAAGDPETVAYLRSSAKPVQATVCLGLGWEPPGAEQLAIACASHNGEPEHVAAVRTTLRSAGLTEDHLRCPEDVPASAGAEPATRGRVYHNCSGKHAAMLAATVASGGDPSRYLEGDTEIHRGVRSALESLAGSSARAVGVDGCGVPTFAFTLTGSAAIYARIPAAAAGAIAAMRAHPFLVAGTRRICTAVMTRVPGMVLKVGAEGLICGALIDRGLGFALKTRDGGMRGREPAALHVLEALGLIDGATRRTVLEELLPRIMPAAGTKPDLFVRGELKSA
jgi:L-asparaginase II